MKLKHPKILCISLGETDDWAHAGEYTEYLDSATASMPISAPLGTRAIHPRISWQYDADLFARSRPRQSAEKMARSRTKSPRLKIYLDDVPGADTRALGERRKSHQSRKARLPQRSPHSSPRLRDHVPKAGKPIARRAAPLSVRPLTGIRTF